MFGKSLSGSASGQVKIILKAKLGVHTLVTLIIQDNIYIFTSNWWKDLTVIISILHREFVAASFFFFIREIRGASLFLSVNFKEPEAVRALTCTLLKEDFGLTIQIPLERLIPTVPLRLNYIHWVEDLIDGQKQPRRGIDIGTAVVPSFVC